MEVIQACDAALEGGRWTFKGEAGEEGLSEDGWTERGMI